MTPSQHDTRSIDEIIEKSAKRGARIALQDLGLDDAQATKDLKDLRQLLSSWRNIRTEATRIFIRIIVHLTLVALLAMATILLWVASVR